jgi:hypothetical protein
MAHWSWNYTQQSVSQSSVAPMQILRLLLRYDNHVLYIYFATHQQVIPKLTQRTHQDICGLFELYSCYHCSCLTTYCSLRKFMDLVGALEHLHDLLHDLGLHALGLLELLAVAVDDSGGSLGDTEVLLM